ncbi:N-acylglucosamine 2-epimerase [Aureococcus anophagefferens]|nr:N-acylglucosamine 2-epimerase [Aureococcus anophagefferens]
MAFRRGSRTGVQKREFTESMDVAETPSFAANAAGYLEKRAKTPPYLWQKRYFKASGHYLRYYGDEGCAVLLAAIELRGAAVAEAGPRAGDHGGAGEDPAPGQDEADAQEWVAALVVLQRGLEAAGEARARRVLSFPDVRPPFLSSFLPAAAVAGVDAARRAGARAQVRPSSRSTAAAPARARRAPRLHARRARAKLPGGAGYLHKKASSAFAGWQLRFFVAVGHYLRYYASDEPGSPVLGAYDVAAVEVVGSGAGDADDDGVVATFALRMADGNALLASAAVRVGVASERAYLDETWDLLETHMWDATHELYAEEADARWVVDPYRSESGNLHTCEALIAAYEATKERRFLDRAVLVADRCCNRQAGLTSGLVWEHFDEDWKPNLDFANDSEALTIFRPWGFQPGHQVEWARFLLTLQKYAPNIWFVPKARYLFDCESIGTAAMLAEATGDDHYWAYYDKLWAYSWDKFVDHVSGSWHRRMSRDHVKHFPEKTKLSLCVDPDFHILGAFAGAIMAMGP